jgi:5-methylcytosine-specific restriction endonuclease McrA
MPTRARKICSVPRCPETIPGGGPSRCLAHRREVAREYETRRPDRTETMRFYRSAAWRKARAEALRRASGLCAGCGARAVDVDHIRALRAGGDPLGQDNLIPLCHGCHSAKSAMERPRRQGGRW